MAEDLSTVAERIVSENLSAKAVKRINEAGEDNTYVDFEASPFGLEWSKTTDFGGWQPEAVRNPPATGSETEENTYRVWFGK